ncbi:MAG: aminotransferase class III-fold pyridoxal phosphate-dependent enzyme [Chloroflexi bacterium]|nr:aminotransferase class III-fold pyridoxal phosphate-dependent enzyme [Chloroflexota bacterium]
MHHLARLDHQYLWHPFTQMRDWLQSEPIVIVAGQGAILRDVHGQEYLDANASIWTNLHGHNHPKINTAIRWQLRKIAHSSALGLANEPASLLAEKLVQAANPAIADLPGARKASPQSAIRHPQLTKVFYSDDGSTAMEVALKLAYEYARRTGRSQRPRFLSLQGAYHGDTVGAVSLGHMDLFHKAYSGLLFKSDTVMAPYCYRCPFNRAKPERADAREYRKCRWECVSQVERKFAAQKKKANPYAAMVIEPLMQGAAGMIPQPPGWLRQVAEIVRGQGAHLIADEVMTGFGRAGVPRTLVPACAAGTVGAPSRANPPSAILFACHHEGVQPDFLALAKGMTGGYLPMAATLTTLAVFDAFLGDYAEFKTFFHGHSFTANQLGSAAALASLEILQSAASCRARQRLEQTLHESLARLWSLSNVGDIRQVGLMAGVELVRDWRTREPFDLRERAGIRVCQAMARRGVLTRPIGNVVVLMPPYCATADQVQRMIGVLSDSIKEAL